MNHCCRVGDAHRPWAWRLGSVGMADPTMAYSAPTKVQAVGLRPVDVTIRDQGPAVTSQVRVSKLAICPFAWCSSGIYESGSTSSDASGECSRSGDRVNYLDRPVKKLSNQRAKLQRLRRLSYGGKVSIVGCPLHVTWCPLSNRVGGVERSPALGRNVTIEATSARSKMRPNEPTGHWWELHKRTQPSAANLPNEPKFSGRRLGRIMQRKRSHSCAGHW